MASWFWQLIQSAVIWQWFLHTFLAQFWHKILLLLFLCFPQTWQMPRRSGRFCWYSTGLCFVKNTWRSYIITPNLKIAKSHRVWLQKNNCCKKLSTNSDAEFNYASGRAAAVWPQFRRASVQALSLRCCRWEKILEMTAFCAYLCPWGIHGRLATVFHRCQFYVEKTKNAAI